MKQLFIFLSLLIVAAPRQPASRLLSQAPDKNKARALSLLIGGFDHGGLLHRAASLHQQGNAYYRPCALVKCSGGNKAPGKIINN